MEIDRPGAAAVHVALDALAVGPAPAGIGRYASTLLRGFASLASPQWRLSVYARSEARAGLAAASPAGTTVTGPGPGLGRPPFRLLWEQARLPTLARRQGAALLHGLMGVVPLRTSLPRVVTIHDATFLTHPELHQPHKVAYFAAMLRRAAAASRLVLTDSEASRRAIVEHIGVAAERVRVVLLAVDPFFTPAPAEEGRAARLRFGLERPFVLAAGVLEPRKNLPRLIAAHARLRARGFPHDLAIAGKPGWQLESIDRAIEAGGSAVRRLGFVHDAELRALMSACDAFAYVPLCEGFGLPVVEAMAAGAAVLTSDCSSLPEVAGGAARLVDPTDVEAIADGLAGLLADPDLRAACVERGRERVKTLSPEALARGTAAVWSEALGQ